MESDRALMKGLIIVGSKDRTIVRFSNLKKTMNSFSYRIVTDSTSPSDGESFSAVSIRMFGAI